MVNDRSNGFFDASTSSTLTDEALTLVATDTAANSFDVIGFSMSEVKDTLLHFNGQTSTEIINHEYSQTSVQAERQVALNNAPYLRNVE